MMLTGVIKTFAICRWYRFHWPWFFTIRLFSISAFRVPRLEQWFSNGCHLAH